MRLAPTLRKFALAIHLTASVGWVGAVIGYLALGVAAVTQRDLETVRGAWVAMDVMGWYAIVPLAVAALATGIIMSLGTPWCLFRHYWVLISLGLTILSTVVLVLHMPTVDAMAGRARAFDGSHIDAMGGDLLHPSLGLVVLLTITALNVYKPRGLTRYGWREQREERVGRQLRRKVFLE